MAEVGEVGVFHAPPHDTGNQRIFTRVGPDSHSAAIVTGKRGDRVNLRVFPDQQSEFSLAEVSETEDTVMGYFIPGGHPEVPPARRSAPLHKEEADQPVTSRTPTTTRGR